MLDRSVTLMTSIIKLMVFNLASEKKSTICKFFFARRFQMKTNPYGKTWYHVIAKTILNLFYLVYFVIKLLVFQMKFSDRNQLKEIYTTFYPLKTLKQIVHLLSVYYMNKHTSKRPKSINT